MNTATRAAVEHVERMIEETPMLAREANALRTVLAALKAADASARALCVALERAQPWVPAKAVSKQMLQKHTLEESKTRVTVSRAIAAELARQEGKTTSHP